MTMSHAVVLIDHQAVKIMQFDAEQSHLEIIKAHAIVTRQHRGAVRAEHEFFAEVCDHLKGIAEILVTGSHQGQAEFHHYVQKHRPALASQIVNWETVDHPTDAQLLARARHYFDHRNGLPGANRPG
ncbi:MAG: hypothetical protein KGI67_08905 [Pseudomonadota bacterium]|nr:hypothetical protein [Pseudomonadota bacterium]